MKKSRKNERKKNRITKKNKYPQGYKHTTLGWIPNDWEVYKFGEDFNFMNTAPFPWEYLTYEKTNNKIQYIHYGDIHAKFKNPILDFKKDNNIPFIKNNILLSEKLSLIKDGDLIITDVSEDYEGTATCVEVINIGDNKVIGGLHTFIARDKCNLTIDGFRAYIFKNNVVKNLLMKIATGISVYGISKNNLSKLLILLPTVPEQQKIAEIFYIWDNAIEKLQQLITLKEQRKNALSQRLLTGKKRLAGFSGVWKEMPLGELFSERNETGNIELPLLSITADKGVIYQTDSNKKDNSNEDKSKYKRICIGDIGYNTMRMWQGRSALSDLEGIVSPAYTIIIPKTYTYAKYFSYLFKTDRMIHSFLRNSQGLVSDTLNCKYHNLANIKIKVPNKDEQTAIASILQTADKELNILKQKLDALKDQKKGLMQKLLTGQIRVKVKK